MQEEWTRKKKRQKHETKREGKRRFRSKQKYIKNCRLAKKKNTRRMRKKRNQMTIKTKIGKEKRRKKTVQK